ncbi:MAG TPA: tetratricopeptide repeat protein [Xanthomonadales bacterium]|nr:tetratricopeptide repeat protein [Xanthomonadales bacterium]
MNMRTPTFPVLLIILCLFSASALQARESTDEVDQLALAALMLRDGNIDRALAALDQADPDTEDFDRVRFHSLRGMAYMRSNQAGLAQEEFQSAITAGNAIGQPVDAVIYVYLAQISYQLEDYRGALDALDAAGSELQQLPSVYHMRAQSHWLLDEPVEALATLDLAAQLFPQDDSFLRRKVFYLVDMGLFQQAVELGRVYLESGAGKLEDYLAFGNALRASGQLDEAAILLENAQLRYPESAQVRKVLAHVYIDKDQLNAAADVLYQAALIEPEFMSEAAELYRRAGQYHRALALNSQLADQPEKFRQRLALYLQMESYEQAAAMEVPLRRVGLLQEEDLRYAIAYAQFKVGDFAAAEEQLSQLTRPDLFRKAAELRRSIADCTTDSWKCL